MFSARNPLSERACIEAKADKGAIRAINAMTCHVTSQAGEHAGDEGIHLLSQEHACPSFPFPLW